MKKNIFILQIALGLTFFSLATRSFFMSDDVLSTIKDSLFFAQVFRWIPVQAIGIHDILVGTLLILRVFPKYISAWATIWIGTVIILLLFHFNLDGALDALEHAAPFGIALFLTVTYFAQKKSLS